MSRSTTPRISKNARSGNKTGSKTNGSNNLEPKLPKVRKVKKYKECGYVLDILDAAREDAIRLEPRETFDHAIVAIDTNGVLVYSARLAIQALVRHEGMNIDDADEGFQYNTLRAIEYVSKETRPVFLLEERDT